MKEHVKGKMISPLSLRQMHAHTHITALTQVNTHPLTEF